MKFIGRMIEIENFKVFGDYLCLYIRNGPVRDIESSWISSGDRFINGDYSSPSCHSLSFIVFLLLTLMRISPCFSGYLPTLS